MQNLLKECDDAKKALFVYIDEMKDCIRNANRIYRYYLSWLATIVKHKVKIDVVEDELNWVRHLIF